jgi:hypothetical protein
MKNLTKIFLRPAALTVVLVTGFAALFCSDPVNPFLDYSNARAFLAEVSFSDGDTLDIFSREEFEVKVAVYELVESVRLQVEKNRLFAADTTFYPDSADSAPVIYRVVVSMYDTGSSRISLSTRLKNGETDIDEWNVYIRNIAGPEAVSGEYESSVSLSATEVKDDDVLYWWDFNLGAPVVSGENTVSVVLNQAGHSNIGRFWITDQHGVYRSPETTFNYDFDDNTGPQIECANQGYEGLREIVTGLTDFLFIVKVTDRDRAGVYNVKINGEKTGSDTTLFFSRLFHFAPGVEECISVTVEAIDNIRDYNISSKEFNLCYDSLGPVGGGTLEMINPSIDSSVSAARQFTMLGFVENQTGDSIMVLTCVNGTACISDTLPANYAGYWTRQVELNLPVNSIKIFVVNSGGYSLDSAIMTVLSDSMRTDSLPPVIHNISANGLPVRNAYVPEDTVTIQIAVFDQGVGTGSVNVNGTLIPSAGTSLFYARVPLLHVKYGNPVVVKAADKNGNTVTDSFTVYHNRPPVIDSMPYSPPYIVAGELYTGSIMARDPDNDKIFFIKGPFPESLSIDTQGIVKWRPSIDDAGTNDIDFTVTDEMASVTRSFSLTVVDSSIYQNAVRFTADEQDFPEFVEAGIDTVTVALDITGGNADVTGPFIYTAVKRDELVPLEISIKDSVFEWIPSLTDTGYQRFEIVVEDRFLRADTLYPIILVVPPNRPCSLSFVSKSQILPGGVLDMTAATAPDTLSFHIEDPDLTQVEGYSVIIDYAGVVDTRTIEDVDSFTVVIDPSAALFSTDTLSVHIQDRGGFEDSLEIPILFQD